MSPTKRSLLFASSCERISDAKHIPLTAVWPGAESSVSPKRAYIKLVKYVSFDRTSFWEIPLFSHHGIRRSAMAPSAMRSIRLVLPSATYLRIQDVETLPSNIQHLPGSASLQKSSFFQLNQQWKFVFARHPHCEVKSTSKARGLFHWIRQCHSDAPVHTKMLNKRCSDALFPTQLQSSSPAHGISKTLDQNWN